MPDENKKLTRKQEKAARERVKDPEATLSEIGQRADYDNKSNVHRELVKPHVQARVKELMDASPKLQVPALLKKLEEGLEAQEIKFFADKGEVISERVTTDFPTRLGYLDRALELQGLKNKDKSVVPLIVTKEQYQELCRTFWTEKPA